MDAFAAWNKTNYVLHYANITKIILFIALIPPSTAEVERTFLLLNLISTPLTRSLN